MSNPRPTYTNLEFDQQYGSKVSKRVPDVESFTNDTPTEVRDALESLSGAERLDSSAIKGITSDDVFPVDGAVQLRVPFDQLKKVVTPSFFRTSFGFPQTGNMEALPKELPYSPKLRLYAYTVSGSANAAIATSPDGLTWTTRTTPTETKAGIYVTWIDALGMFIAAAGTTTVDIIISTDGVNWTQVLTIASISIGSITWSDDAQKVIITGSATNPVNNIHISEDGLSWTAVGTTSGIAGISTYIPQVGKFFLENSLGSYSTDGVTWVSPTKPAGSVKRYLYVDELNALFAIIGNTLVRSVDGGLTFTTVLSATGTMSEMSLAWSKELGVFVVGGSSSSTERVYTSTDGTSWSLQTTPNKQFQQVHWIKDLGMFVAFTGNSLSSISSIVYSLNGITWFDNSSSFPITATYSFAFWLPYLQRFLLASTGTSAAGPTIASIISYEPLAYQSDETIDNETLPGAFPLYTALNYDSGQPSLWYRSPYGNVPTVGFKLLVIGFEVQANVVQYITRIYDQIGVEAVGNSVTFNPATYEGVLTVAFDNAIGSDDFVHATASVYDPVGGALVLASPALNNSDTIICNLKFPPDEVIRGTIVLKVFVEF